MMLWHRRKGIVIPEVITIACGLAFVLFFILAPTARADKGRKVDAVQDIHVLIYDDPTDHSPRGLIETIASFLNEKEGIRVTVSDSESSLSKESLSNYDVLLLYTMCDIPEEFEADIAGRVYAGRLGLVALHHSIKVNENPVLHRLIGGEFDKMWYPHNDYTVHVEDTKHPVTAGMSEFTLKDEETFRPIKTYPGIHGLFSTSHRRSQREIGWTNNYGKGRVFYFQPGHHETISTFLNKNYQRVIVQAVKWVNPTGKMVNCLNTREARPRADLKSKVSIILSNFQELRNPVPVTDALSQNQIDDMVKLAIKKLGNPIGDLIKEGSWVVVKPNIFLCEGMSENRAFKKETGCYDYRVGQVTDLRVIQGLVGYIIKNSRPARISIAEGSALWKGLKYNPAQKTDGWMHHWKDYGGLSYYDIIAEFKKWHPDITFDIIDLNYDTYPNYAKRTKVKVPGGGIIQDSYYVAKTILKCDVLISVTSLKTHEVAKVTLAQKNMMGITPAEVYGWPRRSLMDLGEVDGIITDLLSYHPPDLSIIDGTWAMEGKGPIKGNPVRGNMLIASKDVVAVDAVGAKVMGLNPWDINHFHYSHNKGFGVMRLADIEVKGNTIAEAQQSLAMNKAKDSGQPYSQACGITFAKPPDTLKGLPFYIGRTNRTWLINGYYDGSHYKDLGLSYDFLGGEEKIEPLLRQSNGGHVWEKHTFDKDFIDLRAYFGGSPKKCVTYAFTRIYSDRGKPGYLWVGSDDGIKIWLNHNLLLEDLTRKKEHKFKEHALKILLREGENNLLVKITNYTGNYGFSLVVCDEGGVTLEGIEYTLKPNKPAGTKLH